MVEHIIAESHIDGGEGLLAIVVRSDNKPFHVAEKGTFFYTQRENPLQLALICYNPKDEVPAHIHYPNKRTIEITQEALFVRKGSITVTVYDGKGDYVRRVKLDKGDVILLIAGGHSVVSNEFSEVIEVKSGPYHGRERDKVEFPV